MSASFVLESPVFVLLRKAPLKLTGVSFPDDFDIRRYGRGAERSSFSIEQPAHVAQAGAQHRVCCPGGHVSEDIDVRSSEVLGNGRAAAIGERYHRAEGFVFLLRLKVHSEDRGEQVENASRRIIGKLSASLLLGEKGSK